MGWVMWSYFATNKVRKFQEYNRAIIILFVQVSIRNENSLKLNFLPQKVHKSFMCNVTDVKQTMAYLNFAFVTNLQFSVCPTVTKTTLIWNYTTICYFQQGLTGSYWVILCPTVPCWSYLVIFCISRPYWDCIHGYC